MHALLPVALVERLDVKVFLETEDKLRAYWKTRRDVGNRGYEESNVNKQILERIEDSKLFIKPQQKFADIVFKAGKPVLLYSIQPSYPFITEAIHF